MILELETQLCLKFVILFYLAEEIHLPKPQFLTKKPKYPSFSYQAPPSISQNGSITTKVSISENDSTRTESCQANVSSLPVHQNGSNIFKPVNFNVTIPELIPCGYKSFRGKKTLKQQAEQACVKEAQASRLALASLQKEIAVAPQVNNFIIEETFAETTVENFIPNQDQPYMEVLNYDESLNRNQVEKSMFVPSGSGDDGVTTSSQYSNSTEEDKKSLSNEKLKMLLGPEISSNVEIMYKDAQGNFVPINDEVLHNLATKEGIQYQIVDEDGHVSELQELHVLDKLINNIPEDPTSMDDIIEITKPSVEVGDYLKDTQSTLSIKDGICSLVSKSGDEIPIPQTIEFPVIHGEAQHKTTIKTDVEFSPDIFFADFVSGNVQNDISITEENLFPYENK
ncbi:uncharacterized protein LOC143195927 [Rhynchophorus ferrugineus]|uniref:uncharacterized protein LOC143195927 n=1 Tax=Rhynchophorus ferrugineus TaxID=354439 RepID=UPI003FCE4B68